MTSTTDPELPEYSDIGRDTEISASPPRRNPPESALSSSEYKTGLQDDKGYAWLGLRVKSRSPNTKVMPFYMEGDRIPGVVDLDSAKTDSVKAVFVEVCQGIRLLDIRD